MDILEKRPILKNKWYLYITEFFSGMAVMAVELGASRLMAPYFSSSQIVWTIIIGTIMIAMALGNIYGGRSADKKPNPDKLYGRILVAAIWIALIPVVGKYLILGISAVLVLTVNTNFLIWAAFFACMIIFVFPLFLLGTVTPSLAKYTMDNLEENGKTVGNLGAFNTIGSIIGTFLPTFVTIPAVGTAITFLIFSGVLLLLALVYFISAKVGAKKVVAGILVFILCSALGSTSSFAFWKDDLVYEGESVYNYLQVEETADSVVLSTNVLFGVQSILLKNADFTGMYYDYAMAAPFMCEKMKQGEPLEILVLGMGTGTYASQCMRYIPGVKVEGVEIDEKITELSTKYFALDPNVKVTTYDGRAYLNAIKNKYDVIMVDAYQDITIPFQMSSVEFFTLVRDHLNEDGIMIVNMNMKGSGEGNINQYLADTISSVFSQVYTVDVLGSTNRELFASLNPEMLTVFRENRENTEQEGLKKLLERIDKNLVTYNAGNCIMTDDKAPVELLGMQVIDELIRDELSYYKEIYETEGLQGILSR